MELNVKPRFRSGFDLPEVNFLGKSPSYDVWVDYTTEGLFFLLKYGHGDFEFKEKSLEELIYPNDSQLVAMLENALQSRAIDLEWRERSGI